MTSLFRNRRLLLLLAILVLPSIALLVLSLRVAAQDRRTTEFQRGEALQIGREVLARLERLDIEEYDDRRGLLGKEVDGQLTFPLLSTAPAVSSYESHPDTPQGIATLKLATQLTRAGEERKAYTAYRSLLNAKDAALADRIIQSPDWEAFADEVSGPMYLSLNPQYEESPRNHWTKRFGWWPVLSRLETHSRSGVRVRAAGLKRTFVYFARQYALALDLQNQFPKLRPSEDVWLPYINSTGEASKLVSEFVVEPSRYDGLGPISLLHRVEPNYVFVVNLESIRADLLRDRQMRGYAPFFQFVAGDRLGLPVDDALPGLRLVFDDDASSSADWSAVLTWAAIAVVTLTFFAGHLLWRDTRRESRAAELRSEFVSSVSHELKTPLTSIRMFAETLQIAGESDAIDSQQRAEYLETIVGESERLTRLLNNVLDFSRLEKQARVYDLEPVDLQEVINASLRAMRFPLTELGFHLQVDIAEPLPLLNGDPDALEQAIMNLLHNAVKYSGKSREIALQAFPHEKKAVIEVTDHGIGIPEEEQARIFERFYRATSAVKRGIPGTGLGLALVAHITEAHGGTIEVKSALGEGSTFILRFPLPEGGQS